MRNRTAKLTLKRCNDISFNIEDVEECTRSVSPDSLYHARHPKFEQLRTLLVCLIQQCTITWTNRRLSLGLPPLLSCYPQCTAVGGSWHNLATLDPARQGNEEEEAPREKSDLRRGLHRSCSNCLGNDIFYDPKRKCRNQIIHHW